MTGVNPLDGTNYLDTASAFLKAFLHLLADFMPLWRTTWHENKVVSQKRGHEYKGLTLIFMTGEEA